MYPLHTIHHCVLKYCLWMIILPISSKMHNELPYIALMSWYNHWWDNKSTELRVKSLDNISKLETLYSVAPLKWSVLSTIYLLFTHMYKYSIGIVFMTIIFVWFSYGQRDGDGDCGMVKWWNIVFVERNPALLPKEAVIRASKNLRSFCCEQKMIRNTETNTEICKDQDLPANKQFPQSQYLFDHLVDIMLRRLDGNPDLIYPDVPLHPRGKIWREIIRQYAVVPEWKSPAQLINISMDDWVAPKPDGLIKLYGSVCSTAYSYYTSLAASKESPGAQVTAKTAIDICPTLVQSIVQYELMYIRMIIDLLANRSLWHSMSTYLKDYYANNRLVNLQSTINEMVGAFTTVNRFYVEWTKQCSM